MKDDLEILVKGLSGAVFILLFAALLFWFVLAVSESYR